MTGDPGAEGSMRGGSPEARESITDSYICPITQVAPFAGVGPNVHIDRAPPCPRDAGESHLSCRHQCAVLVKNDNFCAFACRVAPEIKP